MFNNNISNACWINTTRSNMHYIFNHEDYVIDAEYINGVLDRVYANHAGGSITFTLCFVREDEYVTKTHYDIIHHRRNDIYHHEYHHGREKTYSRLSKEESTKFIYGVLTDEDKFEFTLTHGATAWCDTISIDLIKSEVIPEVCPPHIFGRSPSTRHHMGEVKTRLRMISRET